MKTILDFYVFKIRKKREQEFYPLDNIEDTDFEELIGEFHNWLRLNPQTDTINEKTFSFNERPEIIIDENRDNIVGFSRFDIGNYGYKSEINHLETGRNLFIQETNHTSTYPLFLGFHFQSGMETGMIALQQEGNYAMKSQFLRAFTNFLNETDRELMLKMNSFLPESVIMEMLNGATLKKIKFIKYTANRDEARNIGFTPEEVRTELQYVIKNSDERRMRSFFNSITRNFQRNRANFVELDHFDYDTFNILANVNGSQKTFYPSDFNQLRGTIDISSDLDYDNDNRATYDSLKAIARLHLSDFTEELIN